ncbi:3-phosphoshikimate 1-carboxyvinyltransferase [Liquorilactobacillus satsumensis]|uniref:3-phosphoshikimate 1-carboxyvinyltransferase n=1 Tax=Liquorilactobacillus satsumensis TaxID=259059 RepID=UPI0039EADF56
MEQKKLTTHLQHGLNGALAVPGDKSISHRALMLGAIAQGTTTIKHFLSSADCLSTLRAMQDLGIKITRDGDNVSVEGKGLTGLKKPEHPLNMGNSGTTTRLLMGLLAGQSFETELFGDTSLQKRPMRRVSEPLAEMGASILTTSTGTLPAKVIGKPLHGAQVKLKVASAQVKSALILAALQAKTPSTIIEKLPTRDHTERMLQEFGAQIETAADHLTITVQPQPRLLGQTVIVPGDISSAAFFIVAATISKHSEIVLKNVNINETRTGILSVLQKMGGNLQLENKSTGTEPAADLRVKYATLSPIQLDEKEIPAVIDELPLVALLAACAHGRSILRGAQELRVKETDRIATVALELRKLGVLVQELPDGLIIDGRPAWDINDPILDSHGDHRIGMMMAIAALRSPEALALKKPEAIAVSYPTFFSDLESLITLGEEESK